jgi:2-C-methyl-D-erythritol 4-phosphate cytidylyltransferase
MTVALIVAAGSGERLGANRPKALVPLAGRPMYQWSLEALLRTESVRQVVIAMPPGTPAVETPPGADREVGVERVEGGTSRSESVLRALQAAEEEEEVVLVHDAARPLLSAELAAAVIEALLGDPKADAAIAAAAVSDTIKRADDSMRVIETLARSELWAVQTPQVFRRQALLGALAVGPGELAAATDDAGLIERAGGRVILVPSPVQNIKVTTPVDLRLAELLIAERGLPHD